MGPNTKPRGGAVAGGRGGGGAVGGKAASRKQGNTDKEVMNNEAEIYEDTDMAGKSACGVCAKAVLEGELGIECELCEAWFHIECQKIPGILYEHLGRVRGIKWYCQKCDDRVAKVEVEQEKLEERQQMLKDGWGKMVEEQEMVKVSLRRVEEQHSGLKELMQSMQKSIEGMKEEVVKVRGVDDLKVEVKNLKGVWGTRVDKLEEKFEGRANIMTGVGNTRGGLGITRDDRDVAEQIMRYERRDNLIIMGIKEGEDALEVLKNIGEILEQQIVEGDITNIERVGKGGEGKNRPVRVIFRNKELKQSLLKIKINLKYSSLNDVYLSPDLTPKQQMLDKSLRDKLKELRKGGNEGYKIKRGEIIRVEGEREAVVVTSGQELVRDREEEHVSKNERIQGELVPPFQRM